jgi:hypothetical protein
MTDKILADNQHRPWPIPTGQWQYYQEWNNALFLHWIVPVELIRDLVPAELPIDTFEGKAWVSLVAFTMEKIRPRLLPSLNYISNFHEINLRTYVNYKGKSGVYFLNIEAEKALSTFIARQLSGLPYEKAEIRRFVKGTDYSYTSVNKGKNFKFNTDFTLGNKIESKSDLDKWLTERYSLYLKKDNKLYRYQIHHAEWPLHNVAVNKLECNYAIKQMVLNNTPPLQHYSKGIRVIAWGSEQLN